MSEMKIFFSHIFLILSVLGLNAQKNGSMQAATTPYDGTYANLHYWSHQLSNARDTVAIKNLLSRTLQTDENTSFRVASIVQSLTATHLTLVQYHKGIEVYGGGAKVAVNGNNVLFRCLETVMPTHQNLALPPASFNVLAHLQSYKDVDILISKPVYLNTGDVLVPGWYATFTFGQDGYADAAWLADGTPFFVRDRNRYFSGPDSIVSVKVFNPDPITPIGQQYGGTYTDQNDGNTAVLDPLRATATVPVNFDNGVFSLLSDYVEITEHSNPSLPIVTATQPSFYYSRTDDGFEQVNAYYHIMQMQFYLQQLGYNLVNYAIHVDAQGYNGADNSAFTPGTNPPRLTFGEGGVDDAEDADVVVHEYGHAISESAAPNTYNGLERGTLDEAFGDYIAVSYKRNEYSFGSNWVFNWDGHNPFWQGRTVDNPNSYCYTQVSITNIYKYTTMWNAAMFEIWDQLGKTYTDKLQIEALHGYYQNMSLSQAAMLVVDADLALSGGASAAVIWQAFDRVCILNYNNINEHSTEAKPYDLVNSFIANGDPLKILWHSSEAATAQIVSLSGQLVAVAKLNQAANEIYIPQTATGVYLLTIQTALGVYAERILVVE